MLENKTAIKSLRNVKLELVMQLTSTVNNNSEIDAWLQQGL